MQLVEKLHQSDEYIYHLCSKQDWDQARKIHVYSCPSLAEEGFIHFSYAHQVEATLQRLFKDRTDMVLLEVLVSSLGDIPLRQEDLYNEGQIFPHVYGPIPTSKVIRHLRIP